MSGANSAQMILGRIPVEIADGMAGMDPPEEFPAEVAFTPPPPPFVPGIDIGRVEFARANAPFGASITDEDMSALCAAFAGAREDPEIRPLWEERRDAFLAKYPALLTWLTPREVERIHEHRAKLERARREGRKVA